MKLKKESKKSMKSKIYTRTKTDLQTSIHISTIFSLLVIIAISSSVAGLFFTLFAISIMPPKTFSIATLPENENYAYQISSIDRFEQLTVKNTLVKNLRGIGRRGPYVRVVIPIALNTSSVCNIGSGCLKAPLFLNTDYVLPILKTLYPSEFGNYTQSQWESLTQSVNRTHFQCVVQELRQANQNQKYGFLCDGVLNYEEAKKARLALQSTFFLGNISFAPSVFNEEQIKLSKTWSQDVFSIFYETLWLPSIESRDRLVWLTGYDLSLLAYERPLLFIIPKYPEVNAYCDNFENVNKGISCLREPAFAGLATGLDHYQIFLTASRQQASGFDSLINPITGYYIRGVIWQLGNENFYRFFFNDIETPLEIKKHYDVLAKYFKAGVLTYVPSSIESIEAAKLWVNPGFPIYVDSSFNTLSYIPYTEGESYGRIRLVAADKISAVETSSQYGFQDILILEKAPFDLKAPVSGIITAEQQSTFASHLALRLARRGTANAFIKDAINIFNGYEGKLVKLSLTSTKYAIDTNVDEAVAREWWSKQRPHIRPPRPTNTTYRGLDRVIEMTDNETPKLSRFGGKVNGLANIYKFLPQKYQIEAFGIPFSYFYDFIRYNGIPDVTKAPVSGRYPMVTYEQFYENLLQSSQFNTDPSYRQKQLEYFIAYADDHGRVSIDFNLLLQKRIKELWNSDSRGYSLEDGLQVRVRFRSSSNMEDALEFNGAGLYDSTTVCMPDELDGDTDGPSICDPTKRGERTIHRALIKVWMSVFNPRAYEEREHYQLPQASAAMAILVNTGTPDEISNGVALSGYTDYIQDDKTIVNYVITTQKGEESIVSPNTALSPEIDIVQINKNDDGGANIFRIGQSSLVPESEHVLNDSQLYELGSALRLIEKNYPFDLSVYPRERILSDIEYKFTSNSRLIIKQHRPFLIGVPELYLKMDPVPAKPNNLSLVSIIKRTVKLQWADLAWNEDQYIVERKKINTGENYVIVATLGPGSTQFLDPFTNRVFSPETYLYRVRAENSSGKSEPSNEVSVTVPPIPQFIRGDANNDGMVDMSDPITVINYLYVENSPNIECLDAADANDSGELGMSDAIYALEFLFKGGPKPPDPYPYQGIDRTVDPLGCDL